MKIAIILCLFTFSTALPFWGAGKFNKNKAMTTGEYCKFLYKVTASHLPAPIRQKALQTIVESKCFNRKVSQHQRNAMHKTFRSHHKLN